MYEEEIKKYPITFTGKEPGKTSIILVGIHGNEDAGLKAIEKIIPYLKIDRGTVIFEVGNKEALMAHERPVGRNLNRMFRDEQDIPEDRRLLSEFTRSRYLMSQFDRTDAVFDIHTSRNKDSKKLLICEKGPSLDLAECFDFDLICTGFGKFQPGSTDEYMARHGKIGICAECGQHEDPEAVNVATKAVWQFLAAMEHVNDTVFAIQQRKLEIFFMYTNKTMDFTFAEQFSDFQKIKEGTIIGYDGEGENQIMLTAPEDCLILFPVVPEKGLGEECYLLAKEMPEEKYEEE